jgi:carboxyl-terminal processing protease
VANIRGKVGSPVSLRVLRGDRVVSLTIKREIVPWTQVELNKVSATTSVLTIGYFTEKTPKLVEERLKEFNASAAKTLIVDLRYNAGGGFTQAIQTAGYFVPKGTVVASTEDRNHKVQTYKSESGLLPPDVNVLVVVNHDTFCAAELMAAALRADRGAKIIGEDTFGKWDTQTVDVLANGYGVKYTVMNFSDPRGERYPNVGLKPDVTVDMPKEHNISELRMKYGFPQRLALDTQLKAAVELAR